MELEEFNRHFSDEITKKIKLFARRALLSACYDCLIVEDKENKKRAFCTHCKKWVEIPEDNRHTGSPQYILMDGKSPLEIDLGPFNVIKKVVLKKIKGTVIEKVLKDHDVIKDYMKY